MTRRTALRQIALPWLDEYPAPGADDREDTPIVVTTIGKSDRKDNPYAHDGWSTPPALFRLLDAEFHFTLDAAASAENALCPEYFSAERSALTNEWGEGGAVWLNPPYSKELLGPFVHRAAEQLICYRRVGVLLIPGSTDRVWYQDYILPFASEIRLLRGRVRFWEHGAPGEHTAAFPSHVVMFSGWGGFGGVPAVRPWDWRAEL